jgi:hypothetical protein
MDGWRHSLSRRRTDWVCWILLPRIKETNPNITRSFAIDVQPLARMEMLFSADQITIQSSMWRSAVRPQTGIQRVMRRVPDGGGLTGRARKNENV